MYLSSLFLLKIVCVFLSMRLTLITLFLILNNYSSFSQASIDTFNRAIGIDATFINNFIPLENRIGASNAFQLHVLKKLTNDRYRRQAFFINFFGGEDFPDEENGRVNHNIDFRYKIGNLKKVNLYKSFYLLYGFEARIENNYRFSKTPDSSDDNLFTKNSTNILDFRFGPLAGLEFQINSRLSLFTEALYNVGFRHRKETFKSMGSPEDDFKEADLDYFDIFSLPSTLVLFYKF